MSDFLFYILAFLICAIIFGGIADYNYSVIKRYNLLNYLETNGKLATGKVLSSEEHQGSTFTRYYLTYEYQSDELNQIVKNRKEVDWNTYFLYSKIDKQVEILYDPKKPKVSDISGNNTIFMLVFGAFFIDIGLIIWGIWSYKSS